MKNGSAPSRPSGIGTFTMRFLFALLAAIAVAFGASSARAQEIRELPLPSVELAPGAIPVAPPRVELGPAILTPVDAPRVAPNVPIPPVPASYVTRDLGWLKLSYPKAAAERVEEDVVAHADQVKAELVAALGQPVLSHVEVRVAPTTEDMARLAPIGIAPPAYADGVSFVGRHYVLLSLLAPRGGDAVELERVFRHELTHVALEDAVLGHHVPAWFNEGLAMNLSGEHGFDRAQFLVQAALAGKLIPFADLDRGMPADPTQVNLAYAESGDVVGFLLRSGDKLRFASLIDRVREGTDFDRAIADAYGSDIRKLEFQWRTNVDHRYSMLPMLTGGGIIWVAVIVALGWAYVKKRRRAKQILARWEREEAYEDRLRARLAELRASALAQAQPAADGASAAAEARPARDVKVEHDGGWYTLH